MAKARSSIAEESEPNPSRELLKDPNQRQAAGRVIEEMAPQPIAENLVRGKREACADPAPELRLRLPPGAEE